MSKSYLTHYLSIAMIYVGPVVHVVWLCHASVSRSDWKAIPGFSYKLRSSEVKWPQKEETKSSTWNWNIVLTQIKFQCIKCILDVHYANQMYTASVRPVYTLTTLEFGLGSLIQCLATLGLHWPHYSVCTVYTGSVRPVYTLATLSLGLGYS